MGEQDPAAFKTAAMKDKENLELILKLMTERILELEAQISAVPELIRQVEKLEVSLAHERELRTVQFNVVDRMRESREILHG